jgi:SEC-C motif-containing protein
MAHATQDCPCGGGRFERCCARFIVAGEVPATAEQLMRSRYSAYALGNADYLRATWHASTRPATLDLSVPEQKWLGLQVREARATAEHWATVEFVARWREAGPQSTGRAHRLHERSRFVREGGRWYYVDGDILQG